MKIVQDWDYGRDWKYPDPLEVQLNGRSKYSREEDAMSGLISCVLSEPFDDARHLIMSLVLVYFKLALEGGDSKMLFAEFSTSYKCQTCDHIDNLLRLNDEELSMDAYHLRVVDSHFGNKRIEQFWP